MIPEKITSVILAGGESSRMGRQKAFMIWRNKQLIQWVFDVVTPFSDQIIISANCGDYSFLAAEVVPDRFRGCGPLAGIEAGFSHSRNEKLLVVSCDSPGINNGLIEWLISHSGVFDITIPVHDGQPEPLIGLYRKALHIKLIEELENGNLTPHRFIRTCKWQGIDILKSHNFYTKELFINLNGPNDLNL